MKKQSFEDLKRQFGSDTLKKKEIDYQNQAVLLQDDFIEADIPHLTSIEFSSIQKETALGPHGYFSEDYRLEWINTSKEKYLTILSKPASKKLKLVDCPDYLISFLIENKTALNQALIESIKNKG
jgi:hypothetical protein